MMQITWNVKKKNAFIAKTCGLTIVGQCDELKCTQNADAIVFELNGKTEQIDLPYETVNKLLAGTLGNLAFKKVRSQVKPKIESLIATEAEVIDPTKVVCLVDATEILQPVRGTSASSIYRVIALRDDLKLAARYTNNTVSLRAEGAVLKYTDQLKQASMPVHAGKFYASAHMSGVDDPVMMRKVVSSVIGALGIEFDRTLTTLSKLEQQP